MAKDAIVSEELAKKFSTEKDTPYLRWVRGEGLDIISAHYVRNLRTVELKPWARRGGAQVAHVMRADDVETFAAHPAQVRRVFFGREFLCQLFRDDGVLGHALLLAEISRQWSVISKRISHLAWLPGLGASRCCVCYRGAITAY